MDPRLQLSFACPQCFKKLRAPVSAAGKQGKCHGCGTRITVPKPAPPQQPPPPRPPVAAAGTANAAPPKPGSHQPGTSNAAPPRAAAPQAAASRARTSRAAPPSAALPLDRGLPRGEHQTAPAKRQHLAVEMPAAELQEDFGQLIDQLQSEAKAQIAQRQRQEQSSRLTDQDIERAISGSLPKNKVSLAYRFHLAVVAAAMVTLPIIYVAMVVLAGWGVVHYVTQVIPSLTARPPVGRGMVIYFAAVATPAIVGTILVVFMIKPLFFRTTHSHRSRSLTRTAEPLIFALVDRICESTGAPKPTRIDVDYNVNASAQPSGGLLSVATGSLVLTIGVPLIAGLSARQLAGVLAHEFGHFSQKIGMGATLLIRKVNLWFVRVVYERDALDDALDDWISSSDWRIALILQLAKFGVWLSRGVLFCLMLIAAALSAGLMRQMEFDADRYEYGLVGGKTFRETFEQMRLMSAAQHAAIQLMQQFSQSGHLADDLILIGEKLHAGLPADAKQELLRPIQEASGGWLDSHPPDASRIAKAQAVEGPGLFHLQRPARDLITHYDALCKGVTADFLRDQLGTHVMPDQLTPTAKLLAQTEA